MNLSNPSIFERLPASLTRLPAVRLDDALRDDTRPHDASGHDGSRYDALRDSVHRAARVPLSRSTKLLHAVLTLWLLAAFVGASMVASVLAHLLQSGDSMRLEIAVLVSVGGIALTWFALRQMRVLIDRADHLDW